MRGFNPDPSYVKRPFGLNIGAGQQWHKDGWEIIDHKLNSLFVDQATNLPFDDETFDAVFAAHVVEHISHYQIEEVLTEINRVLKHDGIFRLLTPDLRKLAAAYVNNDSAAMDTYLGEGHGCIKKDFGLGQSFMGFILGQGNDSILMDSEMSRYIGSYGHIFCYDYEMMYGLLSSYGFKHITHSDVVHSKIPDHKELRSVPYDMDREVSLVVECEKDRYVPFHASEPMMYRSHAQRWQGGYTRPITLCAVRVASFLDRLLFYIPRQIKMRTEK